ncbi:intracellular protein transport protein USO1-like isoform X2 [Nilaparvata lugens]|uniref:intracellular protein transport protein USO1-like isoform X2 n=1 Tax=Nilaparvata lugens TaxID=108931 RepID=UPI00193D11B2|nr:intracellular protein transport protein USO1-like isoform X2 [Nilaparvata lugens]
MKDVILVGDDDWSNIDDCKIKQEYDSADEEELIWRKYSAIEQPNTTTYQTSTIFTTPVICSQSRPTAHEQSEPNETILQHILVTEPQPLCPMRSILKNNINQEVNRPTGSNFLLRDRTSIKRRSRLVEEEMEEEQHLRTAARRRSSKNKSESMEQMKRKKHQSKPKILIKTELVKEDQIWVKPNPKRRKGEMKQIHHNIMERNRRQEIAYLFDRLRQTVDYVAQVNDTEWHHHHMRNSNWRSKFATLNSAVKSIRNLEEQGKRLEREQNAQRRLNTKLMGQLNLLWESNAKLIKQLTTQSTSSSFKNHHYSDYSSVEEEDDDDDDDDEEEEVEVED